MVSLADAVLAACERSKIEASFFEITTAMAFMHFSCRKVDWAVVEVGLGGRLDATNVSARVAHRLLARSSASRLRR